MAPASPHFYTGTSGSLQRGARLLGELASAGKDGLTLGDLITRTGMPRATVHRTCAILSQLQWIDRDASTRKYRLGLEVGLLGLAAQQNHSLASLAVPVLEQLSRDTGQTSYLLVRSQNSATCLARVDGQTQIRTFLLEVGDRWPLGRGAGGMAILAALDPDEAEAILVQNLDQLTQREDETALRARLAATRASGIARHANLLLQDVSGMGKAVFDRAGRPIMAISMGYVSLWMDAVQERDTRNHLVQAAGLLSRRLT